MSHLLPSYRPTRRAFVSHVAAGATAFAAPASAAADWSAPAQMTFIVPFAAGSSPDIVSRILARELAPRLKTVMTIDNRTGAAGNVGMRVLAQASADGSIIGYGATTSLCINPHLFKSLPFDPAREFLPITEFIRARNFVLVPADLPVRTMPDLVQFARIRPEGIFYTSGSVGSTGHLSGELLRQQARLPMTHVPVQSAQVGLTELAAGRVHMMVDNTTSAVPFIQAGRIRAIAITSARRAPQFPDVPTVAESGFPGFEVEGWGGMLAPAGAPAGMAETLAQEVNSALDTEALKTAFAGIGAIPTGGTPAKFRQTIHDESAKWKQVIRTAGITLE